MGRRSRHAAHVRSHRHYLQRARAARTRRRRRVAALFSQCSHLFAACRHKAHNESGAMKQTLCRWCSPESLRIYARINPRDYAARVRRMSSTDADSALEANLPVLDDSALHANLANIIGPLENGRDIADTCGVHEESDEEGDESQQRRRRAQAVRPRRRHARRRERSRQHGGSNRRRQSASSRQQPSLGSANGSRTLAMSTSTTSSQTRNGRARAATLGTRTTSARARALSSSSSAARAQTSHTKSLKASSSSSSDLAEGHLRLVN